MVVAYRNYLTVELRKVIDRIKLDNKETLPFPRPSELDIFVLP